MLKLKVKKKIFGIFFCQNMDFITNSSLFTLVAKKLIAKLEKL